MTHTNLHPYPLPFPNEDQRIQISSYSSLANALGADPGYTSRRKNLPTNSDAIIDKQAIYASRPPVSNPSYPYPARNVLNPATPLSAASRKFQSNTSITWVENSEQYDSPRLPPWYGRLPQPLVEPEPAHEHQVGAEFPAIHFLPKGNKMPCSLWDLLTMSVMPDLVDGELPIFVHSPDRWIKVKLIV